MRVKAYTDLEQSKKLAEILPLESADYHYITQGEKSYFYPHFLSSDAIKDYDEEIKYIPCWSLGKLMDILPNTLKTGASFRNRFQIDVRKYDGGNDTTLYQIAYGNSSGISGSWHDMINTGERENLVDACVDMIILLIKQKYLRYGES